LEKLALYFAISPQPLVKEKLIQKINVGQAETETVPTFLMTNNNKVQFFQWYSIAASIAILLASGFGIWGYNNLVATQQDLALLKSDYQFLSFENQKLYSDQKKMTSLSSYLSKEGAVQVVLNSTKKDKMKATLFWNPNTHEVWLVGGNLPKLPEGQQYQMWGMVSGKPMDAGVFDASSSGSMMLPMKPMEKPSMFAVTIEKQGGSTNPNLSAMCLMAEL
jgi:hypothetical protein